MTTYPGWMMLRPTPFEPSCLDDDQSSSGDEAEDRGIHSTELSLRDEANSLYNLLTQTEESSL